MRIMITAMLLTLCLAPSASRAQDAYVDIEQRLTAEELRAVGLSQAQLELLNRLLRKAAEKSGEPTVARAAREQTTAGCIGLDDGPIRSRLKGLVSEWEPGTVFELENGQQWKVLKGSMRLRKPLQSPEIVVLPGVAGRWFLQVDEDLPKARVYRID